MNFGVNLNRQMFVINNSTSNAAVTMTALQSCVPGEGFLTGGANGDFYIVTKGHGGIVKSDIINKSNISWVRKTAPADMKMPLKSVKLTLRSDVNNGKPVVSQDYVARVTFKLGAGFSDEDTYVKTAVVRATSAMTTNVELFYNKLAASFFINFKRLYSPLIDITASATGNAVAKVIVENGVTKLYDAAGTQLHFTAGIYFNAKSQADQFIAGSKLILNVQFDVIPTVIMVDGTEEVWGVAEDTTSTYNKSVGNGYKIADLEWFCMGERADQYRDVMGVRKSINTKYLVDPTKEYYTLDIQYFYLGLAEDVAKSPKLMTIASPKKAIIDAIVTALGVTAVESPNYTPASVG